MFSLSFISNLANCPKTKGDDWGDTQEVASRPHGSLHASSQACGLACTLGRRPSPGLLLWGSCPCSARGQCAACVDEGWPTGSHAAGLWSMARWGGHEDHTGFGGCTGEVDDWQWKYVQVWIWELYFDKYSDVFCSMMTCNFQVKGALILGLMGRHQRHSMKGFLLQSVAGSVSFIFRDQTSLSWCGCGRGRRRIWMLIWLV